MSREEAPEREAPKRVWRRSLRSLFAIVMIAMLLAVSGALMALGYNRAWNTAIRGAEEDMADFADRLRGRLSILSGDAETLVGVIASVGNAFLSPPSERLDDKIAILLEGIRRSPYLDGIYVGYPNGSFFHAIGLSSPSWQRVLSAPENAAVAVRLIESDDEGRFMHRLLFLDSKGQRIAGRGMAPTDFDTTHRPWYIAAVSRTGPAVTGPYEMAATGALGMSVSQSHVQDRNIVIGADVVIDTAIRFLSAERLTEGTVAVIVNAAGRPIIHSDGAVMSRLLAELRERDPVHFARADALMTYLQDHPPPTAKAQFAHIDGRTLLVRASPIEGVRLFSGDRIVVAAPLDELTVEARSALVEALLVAAAIVIIAVVCTILFSHLVTKSLNHLTASANRLHDLDFRTAIEVPTHIREISTLGSAMNRARDAIFTFALYVPKELVRKGMESGEFLGRSGRRQEVTAIFTDIYDFTTISEQHSPEEVVAMLSDYFDVLNDAVTAEDGTIIQFLGDSIFALWNAPAEEPRHAEKACRAALALRHAIRVFNARQREKGLPEFRTRIGIHTGTVVVGSVGGRDRLQYTAMGDAINVASRLEGMNKDYGTTILVSGAVVARCGDLFTFRSLGQAQAKGRATALDLYELVA
ncbi:adenylate/guanylate cyclase domain-containing protein [Rhizobium sp. TRM95111]|uniref:adenylate/guanylate cyclase domain-containing protein n=1 Tax=Rhizobium alarense TaxID=2846851 RepID=UPI001F39590C|nr:adenylate/guanylate cyclase domain-containing protein [Rhizobium alarense]MCF3641207.1 adenylate/guanylate cyclase domain-containing protein [Rhizobium alarense]